MKFSLPLFLVINITLFVNSCALPAPDTTHREPANTDYIDPTIGNIGHLLQPTRPTMHLPNQLIRVYPIRNDYLDDQISSFPLTIISHRLGEAFAMKPYTNAVGSHSWEERMPYDHNLEITRPWYYSTYLLEDNVTVEFTPGKKAGVYRFTFPPTGNKAVLFRTFNDGGGGWHFTGDTTLEGHETYHGDIKIYVYGVFDKPGRRDTAVRDKTSMNIRFRSDAGTLLFRYAISFVSPQQARKNYEQEVAGKDFETQKSIAAAVWEKLFDQIRVEGGTEAQKRSFYTALYRCYERMVDITEDGRYYSGFSKKIEDDTRPFYVDDWCWDTYLALHPLRMILHPRQEEDMLRSYVTMYKQGGWLPTFPVLFGDHPCMNGFHSSIMMLDAYRKGLRNFDINTAYDAMRKNATDATLLPWRNGYRTPLDDFYHIHGYFPALQPGEKENFQEVDKFEKRQAVAVTLGASYDDWAVQQLAKDLGKYMDTTEFLQRSHNYRNLWNKEHGLFMPKDDKGNWIDIDAKFDGGPGGRDYFDENNGWTYMWQVQHDIPGLMDLMGGKQAFERRLDQFFREDLGRSKFEFWNKFPDATGLVGEFSMGNEPSFHIPYLYNYTGSPWKTQQKTRLLLDLWFKDNVFGIPGDEDGGGMSAFVVFTSMGFYPLTPGRPMYTVGSPVFSKVSITLENGKVFTIIAHDCSEVNKYIQSARIDGRELDAPWFSHDQLINGATLELKMGPKPNRSWGAGHPDLPF